MSFAHDGTALVSPDGEARPRLSTLAAAGHTVDAAVFLDRMDGERGAEPNVPLAVGALLVAAQLDWFVDATHPAHSWTDRCIAVSPPGEREPYERRLVAWCFDTRCTRAVTTRADGRVWVDEPGCVEAAFDAASPLRCSVDGVEADDVEGTAIAHGPDGSYRYALAVPGVYVIVRARDLSPLTREPDRARAAGERLVGLSASGSVLVVRDRRLVELAAEREMVHASPPVLDAAVGVVGRIAALRVEGEASLRFMDLRA